MPGSYVLVRRPPAPVAAPVLDDAQRRVVEHAGGPLLVLAGPGTGKTTTLVEAVVARVEAGLRPDEVLVLTFSRKAADQLRERITARLGRTVTEPAAYTFHAWCYALVRAYGADEPEAPPPRLLSGPERDVRIRELVAGHVAGEGVVRWPESLRPALGTRGFAAEVADLFDRARERGLDGAALRALGERHERPAWVAAGRFLDEYQDVLDLRGELDYAGLVRRAVLLLQRPEVAAEVARRTRAVFVDEYQDTDPSQEELLQLLAGGGRDLVAVGDPDQSIYAFRGADVGNILAFPERFRRADGRPAPVVPLQVSRRAGAGLLAPSRAVAARIPLPGLPVEAGRAHRALDAQGPPPAAAPEVRLYPTVAEQALAVADVLRRAHLQDGLPWSQMAVLVRSGVRSVPVLRRALVAAGVPVSVASDEVPVAKEPAVQPLLAALHVAQEGGHALTPEAARMLLLSPLARALPSALRALGRRLRALEREAGAAVPRPSAVLVRDAVLDPRDLVTLDDWVAEPVRRLHRLLAEARRVLHDRDGTPEEALWALWDSSGWAARLSAESWRGGPAGRSADRDLDAVVALFEAAARLEERRPRAGVGELLAELEAQEIPASPLDERAGAPQAVRLLTAHRSKGLEWDLVVVADVQDGVWPDLRRRGSLLEADLVDRDGLRPAPTPQSLLVDERRLFYVALTRARRRLVVTAVQSLAEDGERPSRLLSETGLPVPEAASSGTALLSAGSLVARLRRALEDPDASEALRAAAAAQLAGLAAARGDDGEPLVPAADPDRWWGLADWTPGARPVREPDAPLALSGSGIGSYTTCPLRWFLDRELKAAGPATAAQGFGTVLHALVQLVADGRLPADPDVLVARLDEVWSALAFEAPWHAESERVAARESLARFCRWAEHGREVLAAEAHFEVTVGDVLLRGSADRLELGADGRVHVVDFKTGKNALAKDDVPENAQLGVYQLAVREGGFDDALGGRRELGGAELVWLRDGNARGMPKVQRQEALPADDPWADRLVHETAKAIRAEVFDARPNDGCDRCPFRHCCPSRPEGRQVTS